MNYRSIVASLIRIVFAFELQTAGIYKPTDLNGKFPLCPSLPHSATKLIPHSRSEAVTTLLYWGMLEAGISLIATNLPSIYFLARKESLQSFAASIRTRVSLSSLRSNEPNGGSDNQSTCSKQRNESTASHAPPIVGREWGNVEEAVGVTSFAMYDMERAGVGFEKPGAVHVAEDKKQQGNMI